MGLFQIGGKVPIKSCEFSCQTTSPSSMRFSSLPWSGKKLVFKKLGKVLLQHIHHNANPNSVGINVCLQSHVPPPDNGVNDGSIGAGSANPHFRRLCQHGFGEAGRRLGKVLIEAEVHQRDLFPSSMGGSMPCSPFSDHLCLLQSLRNPGNLTVEPLARLVLRLRLYPLPPHPAQRKPFAGHKLPQNEFVEAVPIPI